MPDPSPHDAPMRRRAASSAVAAVMGPAAPAAAQVDPRLRELVRNVARATGLGDQLQGVSAHTAVPGGSTARLLIDQGSETDIKVDRRSLPLSYVFEEASVAGGKPWFEVTLGWSRLRQAFTVDAGALGEARIDNDITTLTAIGGAGLAFDVAKGLRITPIGLVGYGNIDDDARLTGPAADVLGEATRGIVLNFEADELPWGAAVQGDYVRPLPRDLELTARLRYNHLRAQTLDATDASLEGSSDFGVFTAFAQLDGPTGRELLGRDLRWIGFAANATSFGVAGEALGFDALFAFGAGLELVTDDLLPIVETFSLRGSLVVGEDVVGYAFGGQLEF